MDCNLFADEIGVVPVASPQLRGCIRYADPLSSIPEYTVFFRGNRTKSNCEGFYSFPINEAAAMKKFSLVIVPHLCYHFESMNTISGMRTHPKKPYKHYVVTKNDDAQWSITEQPLEENGKKIPDDALVIRMHPSCIDHLEPWNIELPNSIVKLPAIVLKGETEDKKIKRASVKSLLYALDDGIIHKSYVEERQVQKDQKIAAKVRVSLVR